MDELFASGIKLAYPKQYSYIFERGDETELTKLQRNIANCPSYKICVNWAKYQKNVSFLMMDSNAEILYDGGLFVGDNSEPLVCRLEDGVVYFSGLHMIMFHGDPLMMRVNELIARYFEAGLYNFWVIISTGRSKLFSRKKPIFQLLDGYYNFNLYHLQPAFYLLLIGWCLSALCFMIELLCNGVLNKRM